MCWFIKQAEPELPVFPLVFVLKVMVCSHNIHVPVLMFQGFFESIFSVWPVSQLFELNGSIHEWWFRWKLDRFVSQICSARHTPLFSSQPLH